MRYLICIGGGALIPNIQEPPRTSEILTAPTRPYAATNFSEQTLSHPDDGHRICDSGKLQVQEGITQRETKIWNHTHIIGMQTDVMFFSSHWLDLVHVSDPVFPVSMPAYLQSPNVTKKNDSLACGDRLLELTPKNLSSCLVGRGWHYS